MEFVDPNLDYTEVSSYYTPEDWSALSDYEKARNYHVLQNHKRMVELGKCKF